MSGEWFSNDRRAVGLDIGSTQLGRAASFGRRGGSPSDGGGGKGGKAEREEGPNHQADEGRWGRVGCE